MQKQKIAAEDCSLFACWSKFSSSLVPRPHPTSVSYCKRWKAAWVGGLGARLGFSHIPPVSIFVTPSFHFHPFLPPSVLPSFLFSPFSFPPTLSPSSSSYPTFLSYLFLSFYFLSYPYLSTSSFSVCSLPLTHPSSSLPPLFFLSLSPSL